MEDMAVVVGLATLIVTVGGIGYAQGRATRKSNEAAHAKTGDLIRDLRGEVQALDAKTEQHVRDLRGEVRALDAKNEAAHAAISERIDSSRAEVLGLVRQLDVKNEAAHAAISERIDASRAEVLARTDRHTEKLDAIARDVAFLAGRQAERDHREGGDGGTTDGNL